VLGTIVALGEKLKILKNMKATYGGPLQGEDVINVKARRTTSNEFVDLPYVSPRRKGVPPNSAPL
jgi:hypothetical protein